MGGIMVKIKEEPGCEGCPEQPKEPNPPKAGHSFDLGRVAVPDLIYFALLVCISIAFGVAIYRRAAGKDGYGEKILDEGAEIELE